MGALYCSILALDLFTKLYVYVSLACVYVRAPCVSGEEQMFLIAEPRLHTHTKIAH